MPVTVRTIIRGSNLGLAVLAGNDGIDQAVRWAHVSELLDPTPWLQGGEFLLTTGMQIIDNIGATEEYVRRLSDVGVVALGLSTGAGLTFSEMPISLIAAADKFGLPLIHVPNAVPLEAIIQKVAQALEEARNEPFFRAFKAQQAFTAAALSPNAVSGIITALSKATGASAMICDSRGDELVCSSAEARSRLESLLPELREVRARKLQTASALVDDSRSAVILPLGVGDGQPRGFLLAATNEGFNSYHRILLAGAAALLSIQLEHEHAMQEGMRRQRLALLDWLTKAPVSDEDAAARMSRLGIVAHRVQAVVFSFNERTTSLPEVQKRRASLLDLLVNFVLPATSPLLLRDRDDEILALIFDPPGELPALLSELTEGLFVGIGGEVTLGNVPLSVRQAQHAAGSARVQGIEIVEIANTNSFLSLIKLGDPITLTAYADSILASLDAHDQQHTRVPLMPTLRKILMGEGDAKGSAASLGVHRHTLRQRQLLIEKITGRSLSDPRDRIELSLALEVRELISG